MTILHGPAHFTTDHDPQTAPTTIHDTEASSRSWLPPALSANTIAICLALASIFYMVLLGTKPLSVKEKTVPFTGDGDIVRQAWYLLSFAVTILLVKILNKDRAKVKIPASLAIFLILCWCSSTWAIMPGISVRRISLTTIIILSLFYNVGQIGYARSMFVFRAILVFTLFMNYLSLVVTPVAIHGYEAADPGIIGDWRGVLPQKNYAGAVCAATILTFVFDSNKINKALRLIVIVLAGYFLYRTHSKTSQGLLVATLALGYLFSRYQTKYRSLFLPLLIINLSALAFLAYYNRAAISNVFNDPFAFTGRVRIWSRIIVYANDNWLTGSGFGSFWNIGPSSPAFSYASGWVSGMATAHNGYLDLLAQVGFPILTLALIAVLIVPVAKLAITANMSGGQRGLLASMIFFCLLHNFTESSLFDRDAIVQVFLMFSLALLETLRQRGASDTADRRYQQPGLQQSAA